MTSVDYRMADYMNPFLSAVVDASATSHAPVRVLDLGCSYGLSWTLLKVDCSYEELAEFLRHEASSEYASCAVGPGVWADEIVLAAQEFEMCFESFLRARMRAFAETDRPSATGWPPILGCGSTASRAAGDRATLPETRSAEGGQAPS